MLQTEPGCDIVAPIIQGALLSTVNLAEIYTKFVLKGLAGAFTWKTILDLRCEVCLFSTEQARIAAELTRTTRPFGLSLGDRTCLALAMERKARVYTTDREWKKLSLGIEIEVIR